MYKIKFTRQIGCGMEQRIFICENYDFVQSKEGHNYIVMEFSDGSHVTICTEIYKSWVVIFLPDAERGDTDE